MSLTKGIKSTTYQKFAIDAGVIHKGYVDGTTQGTIIGVTKDGASFTIATEYKEMVVDGAKGPVKGSRRITKVTASMKVTFITIDTALLKLVLPGSTSADFPAVTPTHDQLTRALQIALTDYSDSIALIGEVSDPTRANAIFCLKNVLADGGFEIGLKDGEEGTIAVEFKAHFDPANIGQEPWFIRWPKEVNVPIEAV